MRIGSKIIMTVDRSKGGVQGLAIFPDGEYKGEVKNSTANGNWIVKIDGYKYPVVIFNHETLVAHTGSNSTGISMREVDE